MNINKEQLKGIGNIGLKIGKSIVVEGTKALLLKGAAVAITTSFEGGLSAVKNITLDDVIGNKKENNLLGFMNKKQVKEDEWIDIDVSTEEGIKEMESFLDNQKKVVMSEED